MDGRRFDELTRALSSPGSRRGFLRGLLGAGLAAAGLGRLARNEAAAQVSQAYCGNTSCRNNPGKCKDGCVCCVFGNGNTRCTPPGSCSGTPSCPPGKVADSVLGCVECLTAADCSDPVAGPCLVAACTAGKCGSQPDNTGATCGTTTCESGAVTSYACLADGTCSPSSTTPCDPYICASDGVACSMTCVGDADCVAGAFCQSGQCVGDLGLGATCTANNQCLSGFCTNGVCCIVAACGTCQACNVGGSLGTCTLAAGGPCTPSDTCFAGICTDTGACFPTGAPRDCEPVECQVGFCQNSVCQYRPVEGEPTCGEGGDCFAMACRGGSCQAVPTNETQSCSGGTECEPNYCVSGICQPDPSRVNDSPCAGGRGRCYEGNCCIGATEDGICAVEFGTCCADAPCCGSACCNDCFIEPSTSGGPDSYVCCPATSLCPSTDPNAGLCCYSNEACLQVGSGFGCIDSRRNCNGAVCDGDCCNGVCCGDGQYCDGQACAALPTECIDNNQCPSGSACVGILHEMGSEGPVISTPGSCCPAYRACPNLGYQGPGTGTGPLNYCIGYGLRCDSTGATCDNAYYVECGNCVNCSPRGSRTRL